AGVDARSRSASESILTDDHGVIQIEADNITVDGFTIEGANVSPFVDSTALGAGIWTNPGFSGTQGGHQILNNIVQNNIVGVYLNNTGTFATLVQGNKIQNNNATGPAGGSGIYSDLGLANATITQNCIINNQNVGFIVAGSGSGIA